jgi:hypothetical protein
MPGKARDMQKEGRYPRKACCILLILNGREIDCPLLRLAHFAVDAALELAAALFQLRVLVTHAAHVMPAEVVVPSAELRLVASTTLTDRAHMRQQTKQQK